MRAARKKHGFTLAEMLIVVAIIGVLGGVAIIGVINYMRSMTKLEYDGYAKEIFVAAQNHLSMAASEGYLGRSDGENEVNDTYYFVVRSGAGVNDTGSLLELLLPYGSIDETVRSGSYIIRYQKSSARVLDVYFWSESAGRFSHSYTDNDYNGFLDADKEQLKTYGDDKSVIGHYGGVDLQGSGTGSVTPLKAPAIEVKNAERLTVTVTNPNTGQLKLELVVTGRSSRQSKTITLDSPEYVLDDITTSDKHFSKLFPGFWPGEEITVQARVYSSDEVSNAVSNIASTNSLFADGTTNGTALISNIRHLENLDKTISGLSDSIPIANAKQMVNLNWNTFKSAIGGGTVTVYTNDSKSDSNGGFFPVTPANGLAYDGKGHSISNVTVSFADSAGLFGALTGGSVSNLELINFSIVATGTGHDAGALAGTINGTTVSNVVAYHSVGKAESCKVTSSGGSAGGLIGSMTDGSVSRSAAALLVSGGTNAGGLIGTASNNAAVTASYSGGHTSGGKYTSYNVAASGNAGGLIGNAGNAAITACYSTCSAKGTTVGGLVGTAGGPITNCYATGLVDGTTKGAFAGSLTNGASASNCLYYEIINEIPDTAKGFIYLGPVKGAAYNGITCLDVDTVQENTHTTYDNYAGNTGNTAVPYDRALGLYYTGYNLKTVRQLATGVVETNDFVTTHYGDWPAPELFVINQ